MAAKTTTSKPARKAHRAPSLSQAVKAEIRQLQRRIAQLKRVLNVL